MKISPQGGDFEVRASFIPPSLVAEMHCIFTNETLSSTSGKQARQKTVFWGEGCKWSLHIHLQAARD